jgi:hypothetical protein
MRNPPLYAFGQPALHANQDETVIASVAKQSSLRRKEEAGLLRRFAPLRKRVAFVAGNDDAQFLGPGFPFRTKSTTGESRPRLNLHDQGSPEGNKKPRLPEEWMPMLALVEGHPNIDAVVFYLLASAVLAATLYYFHTRPDRNRRAE